MITAVLLLMDHNAFRLQRSDFYGHAKPEMVSGKPEVMKISLKIRQQLASTTKNNTKHYIRAGRSGARWTKLAYHKVGYDQPIVSS